MNTKQSNLIAMWGATFKYLNDNYSVWSGKPALVAAVDEAKSKFDAMHQAAATQDSATIGVTGKKAQARHDLEDIMLEVADQVAAFAASESNVELSAGMQFNRSILDQMEAGKLILTAERIYKIATEIAGNLEPYAVTSEMIAEFKTAISEFAEFTNASRSAYAGRHGATSSVADLIRETRSIFRNRIDKMMTTFRRTVPQFYQGYQSARVIIDRTATHASPNAAVANGMPSVKTPAPAATTVS